jgi:hypothetical protein
MSRVEAWAKVEDSGCEAWRRRRWPENLGSFASRVLAA